MKKFKIFFGSTAHGSTTADEKANEWLAENPVIDILEMKYQQARFGDHSICILYEETKKEEELEPVPIMEAVSYNEVLGEITYQCPECSYSENLFGFLGREKLFECPSCRRRSDSNDSR